MGEIAREIGGRMRSFRRMRKLTLTQLAALLYRSPSTVSKYETGEIAMDIETLYAVAQALHIHVEQLLCRGRESGTPDLTGRSPAFFNGVSQFYSYLFDGRSNQLIRCVFDLVGPAEENRCRLLMYMNFHSFASYQNCENTYWGYMEHYDALTHIQLTNRDTPMEKASVQILAPYLEAETKWGLFNGFSSRPMMPIAAKMLFARERLREDEHLITRLKISREDIRLCRLYNMMAVT